MNRFGRLVSILTLALSISGTALAANSTDSAPLKFDAVKMPEWPVTSSIFGGKLLLSDSPETVPADGVMYEDTVTGSTRLFFHHVNGTTEAKKIIVLLENSGEEPVHITVSQYGLGGPGYDYVAVGKKAQHDYLNGGDLYLVEVGAKSFAQLIPALSGTEVKPNMLVNGIYDFTTDRPVKVRVMMMPLNADVEKFAAGAKVLAADQWRLRGTFAGKDKLLIPDKLYNPATDGYVAITLADNKVDRYEKGIDATDGSETINYGNYGIVYKLFLPSTYDGKVACYLNPLGGEYAGAMGIKYLHKQQPPLLTPADKLSFGINTVTDNMKLGSFDGGQSLWVTFSPPGASNLPVKLVLGPK